MSDLEEDRDEGEVDNTLISNGEEHDGFANVMSKILQQEVGTKGPILAKRKTTIMKAIENEKNEKKTLKKLQNSRQIEKQKFLIIPDQSTADYERQLRKLATRGIVALFNAITKAKKDVGGNTEHDSNKSNESNGTKSNVKKMTQANFLDLLKSKLTANSTNNSYNSNNQNNEDENLGKEDDRDNDDDDEEEVENTSQNWSVLKDEFDLKEFTNEDDLNDGNPSQANKGKIKSDQDKQKGGFSFKSKRPQKSYNTTKSNRGSSINKKQRTK